MPDKICDTPCPIVDKKLGSLWDGLRDKISLKIFIPTIALILGLGWYMATEITAIKVSIGKIETQLSLMNGGKGK